MKLAGLALAYWAVLLTLSLHFVHLPPAVLTFVIAGGLPILLVAGVLLWRQAQSGITALAYKDDLTGLGNHRAFRHHAQELMHRSRPGAMAVVLIDVVGLKALNDACGHPAGDELLIAVTEHLVERAPDHESVFRIGGDEFAIVIDRAAGQSITAVINGLEQVSRHFASCGHEHEARVSVGFASNLPDEPWEALFQRADERLREFKRGQYDSGTLPDRRAGAPSRLTESEAADLNIASIEERRRALRRA
jgi:diguanylate cyclase (GGDEF)-like protein